MNILLIVLAIVAVLAVAVLAVAASKSDTFTVQRSAAMQASPAGIFPLIDDLRAHERWSTFAKPDPATRKSYSGAPSGMGAVHEWEGGKSGSGRIAILESAPNSHIGMQLDMLKPIKASNQVVFALEPRGEATEVTWSMQGARPFGIKILHVFFDMDRMCGREFETSLANLKALVER